MSDTDQIRETYARRAAASEPGRYSLDRPGNRLAADERARILLAGLRSRGISGLAALDILEVGCGTGGELSQLVRLGADPTRLTGIDLLEAAVEEARARVPGARIVAGDASVLPFPDGTFKVVYQATALSSMRSSGMRTKVAAEMLRTARPGGLIVSYDFAWNPRNRETVGIDERELRRLFPGLTMEIHRVTLAPPLGRWLGDRSTRLARAAGAISLLRSHRLALNDAPA